MGEMTFKDAAERYGPAVALILALVLLVTLLPGNAKTKNAENVKSGGSSGASAGDNSAGTATTVPGAGTPTLPGTPPGAPGVPPVAGPPRTGGVPLPGTSFPWIPALFAGLIGSAALAGMLRTHRVRARELATRTIPSRPSPR